MTLMPERRLSFLFDPARASGIVLYDLASAGSSDPPLWNAPGERHAWPPPAHGREGVEQAISERVHELEVSVLLDGLVDLMVMTTAVEPSLPPGDWAVRLKTTLICPSKALGIRDISGEAQAVLEVCEQQLTLAISGRLLDADEHSEASQEFVIQIWPELSRELLSVPKTDS